MLCRTARKWVYLYRPDELPGFRKRRLERHLARCPKCAAEAKAAHDVGQTIALLHSQTPVLTDPEGFTLSVMRSAKPRELRRREVLTQVTGRLTGFRTIQWASGLAVVAVAIAFVAQVSSDARKVALLEARLRQSHGISLPQEPGTREFLRRFPSAGELRTDVHKAQLFTPWSLLDVVDGLGVFKANQQEAFLRHISSKYPQLASVNVDDGLDDRERAVLATEGAALMRELESIVRREGTLNEK